MTLCLPSPPLSLLLSRQSKSSGRSEFPAPARQSSRVGILSYHVGLTRLLDRTKHDANERTLLGAIRKPRWVWTYVDGIRIGGDRAASVYLSVEMLPEDEPVR